MYLLEFQRELAQPFMTWVGRRYAYAESLSYTTSASDVGNKSMIGFITISIGSSNYYGVSISKLIVLVLNNSWLRILGPSR
jgi:hypothetical protein